LPVPLSLSPEQRSLRASKAAYSRSAQYDSHELTAPARAGFDKRFLDQVDPDRVLPEAERERRAKAALKAHMKGLALASSRARSKRAPK
jgi:hypothetical protein